MGSKVHKEGEIGFGFEAATMTWTLSLFSKANSFRLTAAGRTARQSRASRSDASKRQTRTRATAPPCHVLPFVRLDPVSVDVRTKTSFTYVKDP
jgi:hypothetical protein